MLDPRSFALNILACNPNIANNPQAISMLNVIRSGDSIKGQEIAKNICNSMGVTEQDALNQAKQFFSLPR